MYANQTNTSPEERIILMIGIHNSPVVQQVDAPNIQARGGQIPEVQYLIILRRDHNGKRAACEGYTGWTQQQTVCGSSKRCGGATVDNGRSGCYS